MKLTVRQYVFAICGLAVTLALLQDWPIVFAWSKSDAWGFATLVLLGLAAEQQALTISVGKSSGGSSITFLPLLTVVILFGPTAGVGFWIIAGPCAEYLIRRKPMVKANFNIAQYTASTALAGFAFSLSGGEALLALPVEARAAGMVENFGPFALFGVVFLVVNNAAVAGAISISQGARFRQTWRDLVGPSGTNLFLDLLIAPMAVAVAALYLQLGSFALWLSILPLFFIRHSYQTTQMLQVANADLLKALVKAIETRDPYTSGHSLRVSHLAKQTAEVLGMHRIDVEHVETAALLHDVGKIDAVYTEILRKPESLTVDERAVIESHVMKGVDLLEGLGSVPAPVVTAVRHHHEREDGTGYPDGLIADDIPLGAKIIVACDAIDAMLSDRPYRKALPVRVVKEQLREHAGKQFDHRVVRALVGSGILDEYAELMRLGRRADAMARQLPFEERLANLAPFANQKPGRRRSIRVLP